MSDNALPVSWAKLCMSPQLYPTLKQIRDQHPVYQFPETGDWMLSRYDDIASAYKDVDTFSSAAQADYVSKMCGGRTIVEMDGIEHKRHRNIVAPVFAGRAFAARLPVVENNLKTLVERFAENDFASETV